VIMRLVGRWDRATAFALLAVALCLAADTDVAPDVPKQEAVLDLLWFLRDGGSGADFKCQCGCGQYESGCRCGQSAGDPTDPNLWETSVDAVLGFLGLRAGGGCSCG